MAGVRRTRNSDLGLALIRSKFFLNIGFDFWGFSVPGEAGHPPIHRERVGAKFLSFCNFYEKLSFSVFRSKIEP